MAGRSENEEDNQRKNTKDFKWKAERLPEARIRPQHGFELRRGRKSEIPVEDESHVRERNKSRQYTEMAPVIEQRQKAVVKPGKRADA